MRAIWFATMVVAFATLIVAWVSFDDVVLSPLVGAIVALFVLYALSETMFSSRLRRLEVAQRQLPAPDVGVLLCDAVDEKTLLTVARQVEAELLPTRTERKRTSGRSGGISVPFKFFSLSGSRSSGSENTDTFEDTDDANVLLGRVLRALNNKKMLHRNLARVPRLALEPDDRFDDSEAVGRVIESYMQDQFLRGDLQLIGPAQPDPKHGGVEVRRTVNYDQLVADIVAELAHEVPIARIGAQLRRRWAEVADGSLVLVEGPWDIDQVDDGLALKLAGLTIDDSYGEFDETVDMPTDLAVACRVSNAMLLDHRAGRLRAGQRMTLGVFGQVSRRTADDGRTLTLEPTAVFERLAAPS